MDTVSVGCENTAGVFVLPLWETPVSRSFCPDGFRDGVGENDGLGEDIGGRLTLEDGEDDGLGEGVGGGPTLHSDFGSARLRRFNSSINSP